MVHKKVFTVKDVTRKNLEASYEHPIPTPRSSIVGTEFRIIMTTLKLVGNCPVTHTNGRFVLSYTNPPTIFCGLSGLWTIFFWVCYGSDATFKYPIWPKYNRRPLPTIEDSLRNDTTLNQTTVHGILMALQVGLFLFPVSFIAGVVFGWTRAPLLVKFLNSWSTFERNLSHCWGLPGGFELERKLNFHFCRIRKSTLGIFLLAFFPFAAAVIIMFSRSDNLTGERVFEKVFFLSNLQFYLSLVDMTADALHLLIFRSIADGYKMIHLHMMDWIRQEEATAEKIKEWRQLIEMVRSQCEVACEYQKPTQVLFATRCLVTVTLTLFVVLNLPWSHSLTQKFTLIWLTHVVLLVLKLGVKIYAAEKITGAETVLVKCLTNLDVSVWDVAIYQQIQFTHGIMYQKPVQIVYGNYIVVNKALIMGIMTQVVTYLIVLMQFSQSN